MARATPPRGLHHIRTHSALRAAPKIQVAAPSGLGRVVRDLKGSSLRLQTRMGGPMRSASAPAQPPPRAWVFLPRPRFARYQGELRVDQVAVPHFELHDEISSVVLLAHLPGVREDEIHAAIHDDMLSLWTEPSSPSSRRYEAEALLPFPVVAEPVRRAFKNGIFEIECARAGGRRSRKRARPVDGKREREASDVADRAGRDGPGRGR